MYVVQLALLDLTDAEAEYDWNDTRLDNGEG